MIDSHHTDSGQCRRSRLIIRLVFLASLLVIVGCSPVNAMQGTPYIAETLATSHSSATNTPVPTATVALPTVTIKSTATPLPSPLPSPTPVTVTLPTPDGVQRDISVPILMYHYVSIPPAGANAVRVDLSVTPDRFDEHLTALEEEGYSTITLNDLILALQTGTSLPEKPIILTFDDGYRDNYENAFPTLQNHNMVGTFFVVTSYIDDQRSEYMSWEQVTEMSQAGMAIECHSYNHPDMRNQDVDYLVWQILGPKEAIEERTGTPVRFFCYPSGTYDDMVIRVLESANYWGATTINQGALQSSSNPFELSRIRVRGSFTGKDLLKAIDDYMEPIE